MEKLSYGMVGGSQHAFIGDVHRKAIGMDLRAELAAGCFSRRPEWNEQTAQLYGVAPDRTYATYREMAEREGAREDGIDFVCVVTPNDLHYEICKVFLEHGISVMCEKPLCFDTSQARELMELAQEKNLQFGVAYAYPGYTMVKVMREMIARGAIGNIIAVNAEYAQDWLLGELTDAQERSSEIAVWRTDPKHSGIANSVGDIGTHIEYTVHYVTGLSIRRLLATANRYGHPLELNANILVEYENGVNGAYWCSQVAAGHLNGLVVRVYGDQGSLEWEQESPDVLRYAQKDRPVELLCRGCGYLKEEAAGRSRIPAGHPEGLYVAFANMYAAYIDALLARRAGRTPEEEDYPTAQAGLNGVRFIHAVIDSADGGSKWVEPSAE